MKPDTEISIGEWVDVSGLIAPKSEVDRPLADIESGEINHLKSTNAHFAVIRSYANSNHLETVRWNTTTTPTWMNFAIVQTETNYNSAIVNNPDPIAPSSESPEFIW